jgi:hypothetical protein
VVEFAATFSKAEPAPPLEEYTRHAITVPPLVGTVGWVMVNAPVPAAMETVFSAETRDSPAAVTHEIAQRAVDMAKEPWPAL